MSDIFNEVDEEVRREQFKKLWDRYGGLLIGACVLLVVAVGGWRGYQWWELKKAAEAGTRYEAAVALIGEGKNAEAEATFAKLATEGTASYRTLARLREAADLAKRDAKAAVAMFDQLGADGSVEPVLQELAKLRAGMVLVDTAPLDELKQRLEPLTAAGGTFRHSARGLLALAAWRVKDSTAMRLWSDMILADDQTPAGTRGQIELLLALAAADKKS